MNEHGLADQMRPAMDQIAEKLKQFNIVPPESSRMSPPIEQSPRVMAREDTPPNMKRSKSKNGERKTSKEKKKHPARSEQSSPRKINKKPVANKPMDSLAQPIHFKKPLSSSKTSIPNKKITCKQPD